MTNWKSARLHGRVMLQPLSASLQSGLRFLQFPLPAILTVLLANSPASEPRQNVGFLMLDSNDTNELAPAFTPAVCLSVCFMYTNEAPTACLLAKPDSAFGFFV
jgi:hypothetical protein